MRDRFENILKDQPTSISNKGIYSFEIAQDSYHSCENELAHLMHKPIPKHILNQWTLFKQEVWDEIYNEIKDEDIIAYIGAGKDDAFKKFPDNLFINVDLIKSNLEELAGNGAKFCLQADLKDLPFVSKSLDVVIIIDLVHHFKTRGIDMVLHEISRVLKPGGRLYLAEINEYGFFRLPYALFPQPALNVMRESKSLFVSSYHKPESYEGPLSLSKVVKKAKHFGLIFANEYSLKSYPEVGAFLLKIWHLVSKFKRIRLNNGFHWFIRLDKLDEKEGV